MENYFRRYRMRFWITLRRFTKDFRWLNPYSWYKAAMLTVALAFLCLIPEQAAGEQTEIVQRGECFEHAEAKLEDLLKLVLVFGIALALRWYWTGR